MWHVCGAPFRKYGAAKKWGCLRPPPSSKSRVNVKKRALAMRIPGEEIHRKKERRERERERRVGERGERGRERVCSASRTEEELCVRTLRDTARAG